MADLSIQEQRNSLAVAQIRRRASKSNRELTSREIKQISKLEDANADLALQQQEGAIEQAVLTRNQDRATHSLQEMKAASSSANTTMNQQVMGITSLSDVITQLGTSGATTAEILDIFSTRGGTAVQALLAQRDGFMDLVNATENADGALTNHLEILEGSTARRLAIVRSEFEETKLVIGEAFLDAMDVEAFATALKGISVAIADNADKFAVWGTLLNENFLPALGMIEKRMSDIADLVEDLSPLITLFSGLLQIILLIVVAIAKVIGHAQDAGKALGKMLGASDKESSVLGAAGSGAGAGAMIGAFGGPLGMAICAAIGGTAGAIGAGGIPFLAEGGVVTKPTLAVVGEAGPEAVVPLDRYQGGDSAGTSINFGSITIYGNPQMGTSDFKRIMEQTLPQVLAKAGKGGVVY